MNSTTPSRWLQDFPKEVRQRFVPAPATLVQRATRMHIPKWIDELDSVFFDRLSSLQLSDASLVFGAASSSLATAKAAHRRGARFILDRACPDIREQEARNVEEAARLGGGYDVTSPRFLNRQIEEYEECDFIIAPSIYSKRFYPEHIQKKTILAPISSPTLSKSGIFADQSRPTFTVGTFGGNPVRKGYVYLLEAWKKLALPNSRLLIRCGLDIYQYPVLAKLIRECGNVEVVGYQRNIHDFYNQCDVFALPSIDDGFGMALFEAMSQGVPSIATTNCGAVELLDPSADAIIVPAYSSEVLADAIERLYRDPDLRREIGRQGARKIASFHQDGVFMPYERGMDTLFAALASK